MPDSYFATSSTNFDDSVVALVLRSVQEALRGGLGYTPRGSVLEAAYVKGTSGTFRSFGYADLTPGGAVSVEDGQADPDIEDLDASYVEFSGSAKGRLVGWTDNAELRSPHNLAGIAAANVARDILSDIDLVAAAAYKAHGPDLFGGTGNTTIADVAAGDVITAALIKNAVAMLRADDVKPLSGGDYALVCHPYVLRDLQEDADFIDEMKFADPATFLTGAVARYAGAQIVPTSRGFTWAGGGTTSIDVYGATLIGQDACFMGDPSTVTVHTVRGASAGDRLDRKRSIGWKGMLGGTVNTVGTERFLNIAVATSLG